MRFATIRTGDGTSAARLDGDILVPLDAADVGELLAAGAQGPGRPRDGAARPREAAAPVPVAEAAFAPVVPWPSKVICVGLNYRAHIAETGRELPEYPTLFAKFADSLLGARDDLVLPSVSERVDWEAELGVVIGRPLYRATPDQAAAAIAGYTVVNDVSMRDWQYRTLQFLQGKMFEHSTPAGPYLVTPDEAGNAADLEIGCEVDGVVMQQGRTSDLLFGPAEIAAYASQVITLRPGDLIATGTPGGVGYTRQPPVYLRPGNVLRTWIEGVGECVNQCVAENALFTGLAGGDFYDDVQVT
jgi:acylpyruvate hydrolase